MDRFLFMLYTYRFSLVHCIQSENVRFGEASFAFGTYSDSQPFGRRTLSPSCRCPQIKNLSRWRGPYPNSLRPFNVFSSRTGRFRQGNDMLETKPSNVLQITLPLTIIAGVIFCYFFQAWHKRIFFLLQRLECGALVGRSVPVSRLGAQIVDHTHFECTSLNPFNGNLNEASAMILSAEFLFICSTCCGYSMSLQWYSEEFFIIHFFAGLPYTEYSLEQFSCIFCIFL